MKIKSSHIRYVSFLLATVLALPISAGMFTGLILWSSPYLFLNSILSTWRIVALQTLGLIVLIITIIKYRWFCHTICPTGVLCDSVSKIGRKKARLAKFPSLQRALCVLALIIAVLGVPLLAIADPVNLFYAFFDCLLAIPAWAIALKVAGLVLVLLVNIMIPHVWCQKICPLGGLQDLTNDIKTAVQRSADRAIPRFSPGRRYALTALLGMFLGVPVKKMALARNASALHPPGAQPESQFITVCIRCGNCTKACPAKIIKASLNANDPIAALTPHIQFNQTYCLPDCTMCGDVCPSGAIKSFSVEDKKHLVIGIARIDLPDCLLVRGHECDRCVMFCEYDAIVVKPSKDGLTAYPEVVLDRCVGCGACQIVCPEEIITISPPLVTPLSET